MLKVKKLFSNTITDNKARRILSAYGGEPAAWPAELRAGLLEAISRSKSLQAAQQEQIVLDQVLMDDRRSESRHAGARDITSLGDRILAQLPPPERADNANGSGAVADRGTSFRSLSSGLWRPLLPALAASLVVVVSGMLLFNDPDIPGGEVAFERWAWEETTAQFLEPVEDTDYGDDGEIAEFIDLQQKG